MQSFALLSPFLVDALGSRSTNEEIDEEEPEGEDLDDSEEEDDDRPKKKKKKERYGYAIGQLAIVNP